MRFLYGLLMLVSLTACSSLVPANTPPQLEATAGASIIITDEHVDAGWFTVDYPDGWRVVKLSIAGAPIDLVFAAPDDSSIQIKLSETAFSIEEATPDPAIYERFDTVSHEAKILYLWGQAAIERREEFDAIYQQVLESIQFR